MRTPEQQAALLTLLKGIITRWGGAIEFWTVACLTQRELGDPNLFVDSQWANLRDDVQKLRMLIAEDEEPAEILQEQLVKLNRLCADLREVFDLFIRFSEILESELETSVLRLGQLWDEVRMRANLIAMLLPLPELPGLSAEQEAYFQGVLDGLYDRFHAVRPVYPR